MKFYNNIDKYVLIILSFLLCLVTMIQEQASVEDGGFDKGSNGNVAGLAGIQAIMQSISSLNGKFIIRLFFVSNCVQKNNIYIN